MISKIEKIVYWILGGFIVVFIIPFALSRGCNKKDDQTNAQPNGTQPPATATEAETNEVNELKKTVAALEKRLAESEATKETAPQTESSPDYQVTADEESPAVKANRQAWEAKDRDLKMATAKKISAAQEAEEKEQQLRDRVNYLQGRVRSIGQTILNYQSAFESQGLKNPADLSWQRGVIQGWTEKLNRTKDDLLKAQNELSQSN